MYLEILSEEEKFLAIQDEKLDSWFNDYKCFEKLKFNKAKEKYIQMKNTDNLNEKKKLRSEIICGTMYKIYEYLKEKKFILLCSDEYDINDIIEEFTYKWINAIDNDYFNKRTSYYSFFVSFVPDFSQNSINNYILRNSIKINISSIIKVLKIYNLESNNKNVTLDDFIKILIQLLENINYNFTDITNIIKENSYEIILLYNIIKEINITYDRLKNLYNDQMLENYIMALINRSDDIIKDNLCLQNIENDYYDKIETKLVIQTILNHNVLTKKQKNTIEKLYGLNNAKKLTINELAEVNGNTKSNVSQSRVSALKKLRKKLVK